MKSEESPPPPLLHLFIRGHPPPTSLYSRSSPPLATLYQQSASLRALYRARSFFLAFIFPARRTFWRAVTKDRPAPPSRTMENIALADFQLLRRRRRGELRLRNAGGLGYNFGRVLTLYMAARTKRTRACSRDTREATATTSSFNSETIAGRFMEMFIDHRL